MITFNRLNNWKYKLSNLSKFPNIKKKPLRNNLFCIQTEYIRIIFIHQFKFKWENARENASEFRMLLN